jgi:hypothetical protein
MKITRIPSARRSTVSMEATVCPPVRVKTRHEWIASLASASPTIKAMKLGGSVPDGLLDGDGSRLANDETHKRMIIRGIENLSKRPSAASAYIKGLLKDLTHNDPYGKFSELAAYDWLIRSNIQISAQISLTSADVLGANGATPDGVLDYCGIYFDIKAFGFHGHLAHRLKERLEHELIGWTIFVEESWDLSVEVFQKLISDAPQIASSLRQNKILSFGRLRIRVEEPMPVQVSGITIDPYLLAQENQKYAFRSANQFTRNSPFFLIFVLHPWFNQSAIHHDFAGVDSSFTRALARRTFMQFTNDTDLLSEVCPNVTNGTTFANAAKLLSGMIFLNVWPADAYPQGSSESNPVPSWIYLNPRAAHPITRATARLFAQINPHIGIDDFAHDNY